MTGTHLTVNHAALWIALKLAAVGLTETSNRFPIHGKFAGWQQFDVFDLGNGQLGIRVEITDAFHLIIEQFDTIRALPTHRKQIKNRAAYRKFAMLDHL